MKKFVAITIVVVVSIATFLVPATSAQVVPAGVESQQAAVTVTTRASFMGPHNEFDMGLCGIRDPSCWAFASTMFTENISVSPFNFKLKGLKPLNKLMFSGRITYFGGHNVPQMEYHAFSTAPLALEKEFSVSIPLPKGMGVLGFTQHPPLTVLQNFKDSPTFHGSESDILGGRYNAFWVEKSFSFGRRRLR